MSRGFPLYLLIAATFACNDVALSAVDDADQPNDEAGDDVGDLPEGLDDLADECLPIAWLQCGETVSGDSGDPAFGRTDVIDFWPVSQGNYRGPEVAYAWEADRSGTIEWRLVHPRPTQVDHDLFVLEGSRPCSADAALERGFNDVEFEAVEGEIRALVLDGNDGDVGEYEVRLDCPEEG